MSTDIKQHLRAVDVMVVDPDEHICELIKEVLRSVGFRRISQFYNGKDAIEHFNDNNVDLLITDWRMKPISGIQLIDYLRKHPTSPAPYLPIIMLTGKADRKDVMRARDVGVTEFVVKPFSAKSIYERVVMLIENPRAFIISKEYSGPNRRRRTDIPPGGTERRLSQPIMKDI